MSVLIRGMKMPNHCGECGIEWCERWKRLIVAGMPSAKARPSDCPITPVPPHGRLIDALWVRDQIIKQWMEYSDDSHMYKRGMEDAYEVIRNAPTIIPADQADKEGEG